MSEALNSTLLSNPPVKPADILKGLVSRKVMALEIGVSWRTLLRCEHEGMPSVKIFGEIYYDVAKVRAWLEGRTPKRACNREPVRRGRPAVRRAS